MEEEIQNSEEFVKKKQKERKQRKGKKKLSFLKNLLKFFTGLAIIGILFYGSRISGWYLPRNSFTFPTTRVVIVNNKIVKTQKIQSIIANSQVPKLPIYMVSFANIKKQISKLSPVQSVYIRRYAFPARILVIIREVVPVITISPSADVAPVAAFTKNGKLIIGNDYLPLPKEYKTLLVLSYGNNGDDYKKWDSKKIKEIEKLAKYVETFSHDKIEYIDLRKPDDLYIKLTAVTIKLGKNDEELYNRIKRLPSILPQTKKVKGKIKYIDLSWEKVSYIKLEEQGKNNENNVSTNKIQNR